MSVATLPEVRDDALGAAVLAHLEEQLSCTRSLLAVVLDQGAAIRAREVKTVVRQAGLLRGEMIRRELLEERRGGLLERCGVRLGIPAESVKLSDLAAVMSPDQHELAVRRSGELKGLLHELSREHTANRTAMQLELGFLDHLMGLLELDGAGGYDPRGSTGSTERPRSGGLRVLDLRA
jgi:hypothetical protein